MQLPATNLTQLIEFEQRFQAELAKGMPKLFGDLLVSPEEVEELGLLIGQLIQEKNLRILKENCSLSISLFLVWCSVYHYKEGDLWGPIVSGLGLEHPPRNITTWLGELFLATLHDYDLQLPLVEQGKKYMTPILMHGYISDYYAPQFLDYLNAVYSSYLEYDLSEQALESLWTDLFDYDQEQVGIRDTINKLVMEEQRLKSELAEFRLPSSLDENSKEQVDQWQEEIQQHKKVIDDYEARLENLQANLCGIGELSLQFQECAQALEDLNEWKPKEWDSVFAEITALTDPIKKEFEKEIEDLQCEEREISRLLKATQNACSITQSKRSALMTEIVKLGQGSLVRGYDLLEEYGQTRDRLEEISEQRKRWEKLLEHDHELGNSTVRQVLTTSLTSLGMANPILFQNFVGTTLRMLDALYHGESVAINHRMREPLQSWHANRQLWARMHPPMSSSSPSFRERARPGQIHTTGVRQVRLKSPDLRYVEETRQLVASLPEQKIPASAKYMENPQFFVEYGDEDEAFACRFHIARRRLVIDSTEIPIRHSEFSGVRFVWCNLYEYWSLALESIMVFDEQGKRQTGQQLPNGFYYVLASAIWKTTSDNVIDHYACATSGYTVYEVHVDESRLEFYNSTGETHSLFFSKYSGISLQGIRILPGLSQDGLSVAIGTPMLVLSRAFLEQVESDLVLTLNHNGAKTLKTSLQSILERSAKKETEATLKLSLEDLVGQKYKPALQTFEIGVFDINKKSLFERDFCLVRGLSLRITDDHLKVCVPAKSILKNSNAKQEGKDYLIPLHSDSEVSFQVHFPKIGWKEFNVIIPTGEVQLVNSNGHLIQQPLHLLQSEKQMLASVMVSIKATTSQVQRVIISDSQEFLHMGFSISRGEVKIPLGGFVDLLDDLQKQSQIHVRYEGELGISRIQTLVQVYPSIKVEQVELFPSEQDDEYLLELNFTTNYPQVDKLRFRIRSRDPEGEILMDRRVRSTPDVFYLHKKQLKGLVIHAEIYYAEEIESVFGNHKREQICWSERITLPNRKMLLARAQAEGLVLKSFYYNDARYTLPKKYRITDVKISSKHFEGEELLRGLVDLGDHVEEIFFYLEEGNAIPGLWDRDDDGVQYDPEQQSLFWEVRKGAHIMGPLENIEFDFFREDER